MVSYTDLKNRVFAQYYQNSYLPSTVGGSESTSIFQFILSITDILDNFSFEMDVSSTWAGDEVTWFTSKLPDLFLVPKFVGESDKHYLDRILLLQENGQDANTIIDATYSVVSNAVSKSQISIIDRSAGISATWQDDNSLPGDPDEWTDEEEKVWGSTFEVQRVMFVVKIEFTTHGLDSDETTFDYWYKPENYSKIEDMVKLYKAPGSTFELLLLGLGRSKDLTSEASIKTPTSFTIASDSTIA